MILNRIDDPRSNLEKAKRLELVRFAQANNVEGVTEAMPAILIRRKLQAAGHTKISIPRRPLGAISPVSPGPKDASSQGAEIDAADDLARQYQEPVAEPKPVANMAINELRAACKSRGIKLSRRDTMQTMREKLGQPDAS